MTLKQYMCHKMTERVDDAQTDMSHKMAERLDEAQTVHVSQDGRAT